VNEDHARVPALICGCGINPATLVFNLDAPPKALHKTFSRIRKILDDSSLVCKGCGGM
jgi:hypothetical protein